MGFQIPGPTTGKVQSFVDLYQAVVPDLNSALEKVE
jgi:hypothetical protein